MQRFLRNRWPTRPPSRRGFYDTRDERQTRAWSTTRGNFLSATHTGAHIPRYDEQDVFISSNRTVCRPINLIVFPSTATIIYDGVWSTEGVR